MMVSLKSMPAMQILADATNAIAEGEVLQLAHRHQPNIDETSYYNVIRLKTAKLFEAAALLGSCIETHANSTKLALGKYGHHLGCAFQIVDDLLDYQADSETLGKNLGDDLAEGKMTLPLIYALKQASPQQSEKIRQAIVTGNLADFAEVKELIVSTGAIDYTMLAAQKETQQAIDALSHLPASPYRDAMTQLAHFAMSRCS
jgi:octaprenyl-diphosphate synthase